MDGKISCCAGEPPRIIEDLQTCEMLNVDSGGITAQPSSFGFTIRPLGTDIDAINEFNDALDVK
jgi:hypothetical protein